jgi:hypothetical protein
LLRGWSNADKLRCRRVQHGPGRLRRVYDVRELDRVKNADFVLHWTSTLGREHNEANPDFTTLAEVATWAGVGEWHLRDLVSAGKLTAA